MGENCKLIKINKFIFFYLKKESNSYRDMTSTLLDEMIKHVREFTSKKNATSENLRNFFECEWQNTFKTKLYSNNSNQTPFKLFQNNDPFYFKLDSLLDYSISDIYFDFNTTSKTLCAREYSLLINKPFEAVNTLLTYGFVPYGDEAKKKDTASSLSKKENNKLIKPSSSKENFFGAKNVEALETFYKANLRPDYFCKDKYGRILFKGEEKGDLESIDDAVSDLKKKCFKLNSKQYGNLSKSFGYAAANFHVRLYLIDHCCENDSNNSLQIVSEYNLNLREDRIRLVVNIMCIVEICKQWSDQNQPNKNFLNIYTKEVSNNGKYIFSVFKMFKIVFSHIN